MKKLLMLLLLAAIGTAGGGENSHPDVVYLKRSEILSDPAELPDEGYLSTGQPNQAVLNKIAAAGFAAVVDLRTDAEDRGIDEKAEVEALGMTYVSLPVDRGADGVSFENAAALDRILESLDGPVLLHCGSGDRVGSLFALSAKMDGASDDEALSRGKEAGLTRSEKVVIERLAED